NGSDLGEDVSRRLLEGLVRLRLPEETSRLEPVDRPMGREEVGEVSEVQDVPEHAGDTEEGSPRPRVAAVDRHEMREPWRALRIDRLARLGGLGVPEPRGDRGDRRRLEEDGDRKVEPVTRPLALEESYGDQRVTSEVEESVLHADVRDAEKLLPIRDERGLDL